MQAGPADMAEMRGVRDQPALRGGPRARAACQGSASGPAMTGGTPGCSAIAGTDAGGRTGGGADAACGQQSRHRCAPALSGASGRRVLVLAEQMPPATASALDHDP